MPGGNESHIISDSHNKTSDVNTEILNKLANISLNVAAASDTDKTHSDANLSGESCLNDLSVKPLKLHGSKCINDADANGKKDSTKIAKHVKFDIESRKDCEENRTDEVGKRVKYDIIIRTAEEDNEELKRSMTKFLVESVARKEDVKNHRIRKKSGKSSKYVVNTEETGDQIESGVTKQASNVEDCAQSRKSSHSTREFDNVIFDKNTLRTASRTQSLQRVPSGHNSIRSAWSPGTKYRHRPKTVYLRYCTGIQEIQTPVIKGLVVDVVENQKPSVVRASKNANIREEFALRQKVEGYRASCTQNISTVNYAQRRFSRNLTHLRNKMAAHAKAKDKPLEDRFCVKTVSEQLFMQKHFGKMWKKHLFKCTAGWVSVKHVEPACSALSVKSYTTNNYMENSIQPIHRESVGSNIKISYERTLVNMLSPTNTAECQLTMKPSVFHSQGLMRNQTILEEFHIRQAKPSCGQQSNTVVIIFSFYGASEKAINSYCRLYHAYGFDAVVVPSYLKHFAWPAVSQELATDLLKFIKKTCGKYDNIVIHAFSMGAYNFTVCMSEMYSSPEMYSSIENRIRAVVYDSLTLGTLKNMAKGVGMGVSKNSIIRTVIPLSMSLYFRLTSKYTVQVYEHYIELFKQKPLQVPTLLFYCKNDPMSEYDVVQALVEDWRKRFSFELMTKSWERSIHSGHLLQHKEEYTKAVDKFLKNVCLLVKIDSKM